MLNRTAGGFPKPGPSTAGRVLSHPTQAGGTLARRTGGVKANPANADLPVFEYTPLEVKQAISGFGRASKDQVQQMVRLILQLEQIPKPDDAADALAIAICHIQSAQMRALLER